MISWSIAVQVGKNVTRAAVIYHLRSAIDDDFKMPRAKRGLTRIQVYSKMFYQRKLRAIINERLASAPSNTQESANRRRIKVFNEVCLESYAAESEAVVDEVEVKYKEVMAAHAAAKEAAKAAVRNAALMLSPAELQA
jgi:hypothetical protein